MVVSNGVEVGQGFVIPSTTTTTTTTIVSALASGGQQRRMITKKSRSKLDSSVVFLSSSSSSSTTVSSTSSSSSSSSKEEILNAMKTIDEQNHELFLKLQHLRKQPYFRLYSVDLLASCEYLPQELFECYSETCEIYPVDDEDVPSNIKSVDSEEYDFELDGWARWDMPSEDYYDTEQFPEDYTGYDGSDVWRFIHDRICFDEYDYDDDHWKSDFNKAVSGLHSMISAQIIRGIQERVEAGGAFTDDERRWDDHAIEFERRLSPTNGEVPSAMENLYFCYMLLLTAASKAKERLEMDCQTIGPFDDDDDDDTAEALLSVLSHPLLIDPNVGVASRRLSRHAMKDSDTVDALWEARMRSRELLRIMNCVQCNKCRFHGKISAMGLSTAFHILVGARGDGGDLDRIHRVQLSALMATLFKFSRAVETCQEMLSSSSSSSS